MDRSKAQAIAFAALKGELGSQRFRQFTNDRAFIEWYVKARYGEGTSYFVTDGANDGGIDAIATEGAVEVVIQSKYEPSARLRTVTRSELAAFEAMAARVLDADDQTRFDSWLRTVRPSLQARYRDIRTKALQDPFRVRFDFVTTKRVNREVDGDFNVIDAERIAPLWLLYEEGFTPPVESVSIEFEDVWSTGTSKDEFTNYVGLVDVRIFLALMDRDRNERLFAQNVRTDLRSSINKAIRETYEKQPGTFWLGNNGIYVICSRASLDGRTLKVVYPSIINGSQTLHSIHGSSKRHACRILVRVLVMDAMGQRSLLNSIVRRTNTQNPMKSVNLAAHDPEQLNIARFLDGFKVFYERREREWQNEKRFMLNGYVPVNIKEVAQWAAVTFGGTGAGTARARVSTLFLDGNYQRLFGRFGGTIGTDHYRRLAVAVFAGLSVKRFLKKLPRGRKHERIAHLLLVKAIYEAVATSQTLQDNIEDIIRNREYEAASKPRVARALNPLLKEFIRIQRAEQKKDEALDLSNFFKRDAFTEKAFAKAASKARLKALATALTSEMV